MFKPISLLSASLLAVLRTLPLSSVLADHAGDAANASGNVELRGVSAEMTRIGQPFLATVAGDPTGIETSVGSNRKELVSLRYDDEARSNYVYWPFLRKGLQLDFMTAEQRSLVHDMLN